MTTNKLCKLQAQEAVCETVRFVMSTNTGRRSRGEPVTV